MLRFLRDRKTSRKIWITLACIIVPSFILWGAGSYTSGKKEAGKQFSLKLFGRNITINEFREAYQAVMFQASMQYGEKLEEIKNYINFQDQAVDRLILLEEAKHRRIRANDQEVINVIQSYGFFKKNNAFNQTLYERTLYYDLHLKPRQFEEQTRQDIIISKLYTVITNPVYATDEEAKNEYLRENEQVSMYYLTALNQDFAKDITSNEDEARKYFNQNPNSFRKPLSFNLEYLMIKTEIEDKTALNTQVEALGKKIAAKEDLNKIAADLGLELKETGLFSYGEAIPQIGWSQDIILKLNKSKHTDIIGHVIVDKAYYAIRIKERREAYIPQFEEAKTEAINASSKEKAKKIAKEKIDSCAKKLKDNFNLTPNELIQAQNYLTEFGLKSGETALFKFGSYIEGIGASSLFWNTIEALKDNEPSKTLETEDNFYIVWRKEKTPYDKEKFSKDKESFRQKVTENKKQEQFLKFLNELKKKA